MQETNDFYTVVGLISYGIAILLLNYSFGIVSLTVSVLLLIKGTALLKNFWSDTINFLTGMNIFLRTLITDTYQKVRKRIDANRK